MSSNLDNYNNHRHIMLINVKKDEEENQAEADDDDDTDKCWYICTTCHAAFNTLLVFRRHRSLLHDDDDDELSKPLSLSQADLHPSIKLKKFKLGSGQCEPSTSSRLLNLRTKQRGGVRHCRIRTTLPGSYREKNDKEFLLENDNDNIEVDESTTRSSSQSDSDDDNVIPDQDSEDSSSSYSPDDDDDDDEIYLNLEVENLLEPQPEKSTRPNSRNKLQKKFSLDQLSQIIASCSTTINSFIYKQKTQIVSGVAGLLTYYGCKYCGCVFKSRDGIATHVQDHHPSHYFNAIALTKTKVEHKISSSTATSTSTVVLNLDRPTCNICLSDQSSIKDLNSHIIRFHSDHITAANNDLDSISPCNCSYCVICTQFNKLSTTTTAIGTGGDKFECKLCTTTTTNRTRGGMSLKNHMMKHHPTHPITNQHCRANRASKYTYSKEQKGFPCPICSKIFVKRKKLAAHVSTVHNYKINEHGDQERVKYDCTNCSLSFLTIQRRNRHFRKVHTNYYH